MTPRMETDREQVPPAVRQLLTDLSAEGGSTNAQPVVKDRDFGLALEWLQRILIDSSLRQAHVEELRSLGQGEFQPADLRRDRSDSGPQGQPGSDPSIHHHNLLPEDRASAVAQGGVASLKGDELALLLLSPVALLDVADLIDAKSPAWWMARMAAHGEELLGNPEGGTGEPPGQTKPGADAHSGESQATPQERHMGQRPLQHKKIHPIVIYPYTHPKDERHLRALYDGLVRRLAENPDLYSRPITVLSADTSCRILEWGDDQARKDFFTAFQTDYVEKYSTAIHAWSVDTCQRWLTGMGEARNRCATPEDVYWLIPGDFEYASDSGQEVLEKLDQIPRLVYEGRCNLCLGEISVPSNGPKQLIDTYGTYGLLYNWFPAEAQGIREITDKPRTEFFAIDGSYLREVLKSRWYPFEQTVVILLHGMTGRRANRVIKKIKLGTIIDPPDGRDTLASALQQVDRMDLMLKLFWRERQQQLGDDAWPADFKILDSQSEAIRKVALVILQQILKV